MSLNQGTASFRKFYLSRGSRVTGDAQIETLQRAALPDMADVIGNEAVVGWCGPRHMMDGDVSMDNIACHGWLRLQLVKAVRKVPPSLLKAECALEQQAELQARGCQYLPRAVKAEIKQRVTDMLIGKAQTSLSSVGTWVNEEAGYLLAETTTDSKIDFFSPRFKAVFGVMPIVATPETVAMGDHQINHNDIEPVMFTPDASKEPPTRTDFGMEFLTWLFWAWDKNGGNFTTPDGRECAYMLEGPLTFFREGTGAHEVSIRKGSPLNSREAMACLLDGKMLRKVKFVLADGDNIWKATVDSSFLFGSLKVPKGEALDGDGAERAMFVTEFLDAWFALYGKFLSDRTDGAKWSETLASIREWIAAKNGMEV